MHRGYRSLLERERKLEVRGPELVVGVEAQALEERQRAVASGLEFGLVGVGFDLDELSHAVDRVERDDVAVEREAFSLLADRGDGVEPEVREDGVHPLVVRDAGFDLLARLRRLVDQRPLVRQPSRPSVGVRLGVGRLASDPQRLVRLRKRPVWRVVVGILLDDRPQGVGLEFGQSIADGLEIGGDFDFDLVHGRSNGRLA